MPSGKFEVIDSFAIRRKKEVYLIGNLLEGEVRLGWFVSIPLNSSLSVTAQISDLEREVEISGDENMYMLLVLKEGGESDDDLFVDFILALNVGLETVDIVESDT